MTHTRHSVGSMLPERTSKFPTRKNHSTRRLAADPVSCACTSRIKRHERKMHELEGEEGHRLHYVPHHYAMHICQRSTTHTHMEAVTYPEAFLSVRIVLRLLQAHRGCRATHVLSTKSQHDNLARNHCPYQWARKAPALDGHTPWWRHMHTCARVVFANGFVCFRLVLEKDKM